MISPFFVGLIADRFFASERVLAALHLVGAVLLYFVTKATSFGSVYALMFIYCLCYFPTIALTNSLTLQHLKDTGRDFPLIRVFGTLGWIAIGVTIGRLGVETSTVPFLLAAGASVVMSIFSLTSAHSAAEQGSVSHPAAHSWTRCAGDAEAAVVRGFRRGLDSGLHSAHLLLLVYQCLSE
jgi:uncharacterized membrane protein YhaH (DUF805 family)